MDTQALASGRLQIRRLHAQYLVSRQHPAPERVQAKLDQAVPHDLVNLLATALSPLLSQGAGGLWLIRHLEVEVDVNAAWEREVLARVWAREIVRALSAMLRDGEDSVNVLWFPDHAAYLARFLVDVAEGRAWNKWQYATFEGLRLLPTSATLRTAICEQPALGLAALLRLSTDALKKTVRTLTTQDARRILDTLAEATPGSEEFHYFRAAWAAWERLAGESLAAGEEWRNALRLYLSASMEEADVGGLPLRGAVLALLCLARHLAGSSVARHQTLLAALTGGDVAALYVVAGTADAEILRPLLHCPPAWVREVGQTIRASSHGAMAAATQAPLERRYTPFGGIFLLLPLLDELPLEEATRGWPNAEAATAAALVRFLLLVKCFGQPRACNLFYDPLVRDLLGVSADFSLASLAVWQRGIAAAHRQTFLASLESWHTERGAVQGKTHILTHAAARGGPVAILMDGARGVWLHAAGFLVRRPERLVESLWGRISSPDSIVLSAPVYLDTLRATFPDRQVVSLLDDAIKPMVEVDAALAEVLMRLQRLPDDLAYLSLPKALGLARPFDLALSVAAQGVMRAFAWRLPGFAGSNLPYLHRNFLDFAGSVEEEATRRVVRLGRPPLHLVLNMTGMNRSAYGVSWLEAPPFALFPEG
jgi:hypothetical protein